MNRAAATVLLVALAAAGCATGDAPRAPTMTKEVLRNALDSGFDPASVPQEKEADFYGALEAFSRVRKPSEFVENVVFNEPDEVIFYFSNHESHTGGSATARKKDGRWTLNHTVYFN
jgi:hypothetical protein